MKTSRSFFSRFTDRFASKPLLGLALSATLLSSTAFAAPPNDNLANAIAITGGLPVTVTGTTVGGSTEPGEPRHTDGLDDEQDRVATHKTSWWKWVSTVTGPVTISTKDSGTADLDNYYWDTQVGVYTGGTTMGSLNLVIRKEDSDGVLAKGWTYLTFNAVAGTEYKIAVDGWRGESGSVRLALFEGGSTPPPPPPTTFNLNLNIVPADSGTVTANPPAGTNGYASGTVVTLTATPNDGGKFSGWTGSVSDSRRTVTVVMNGNKTVNAIFNADTVFYGTLPDTRVVGWLYHGTKFAGATIIRNGTKIPGWRIAGTADFNKDNNKDILLQNANGTLAVWFMNDALYLSNAPLRAIDKSWKALAAGDFNGDGWADVAFQHDSGRLSTWHFQGTTFLRSRLVRSGNIYPGWKLAGAEDVNADSTADLIMKHDNGRVHAWRMSNGNFVAASLLLSGKQIPAGWQIVGLTDINLTGGPDIAIQNSNGRLTAWFLNNLAFGGSAALRNVDSPGTKLSGAN